MEDILISSDKSRLNLTFIHVYLNEQSYWAKGIPFETVQRSIDHSLCYGVYRDEVQIGFARVVTDQATFAYLADVFIVPAHQGKGYAQQLIQFIKSDERLRGLRRWLLVTRDAHELYRKLGFSEPAEPQNYMEIRNPAVYQRD